jgi:hypothetical protein
MSDYSESDISSSEKAPTTKSKSRANYNDLSEIQGKKLQSGFESGSG